MIDLHKQSQSLGGGYGGIHHIPTRRRRGDRVEVEVEVVCCMLYVVYYMLYVVVVVRPCRPGGQPCLTYSGTRTRTRTRIYMNYSYYLILVVSTQTQKQKNSTPCVHCLHLHFPPLSKSSSDVLQAYSVGIQQLCSSARTASQS